MSEPGDDEFGDVDDDEALGEECGRWDNGKLASQCQLAGTEWCDWLCPIGTRGRP